jgi:hypothetical protein
MILSAFNAVDYASSLASTPAAVASLPVGNIARSGGAPARLLDCATLDIRGDFVGETSIGCMALFGLAGVQATPFTYWILRLYSAAAQGGTIAYQSSSQFFGGDAVALIHAFGPALAKSFKLSFHTMLSSDIDIGRLWLGPVCEPEIPPAYGLSLRWVDASGQGRTEAGNLIAEAGPAVREMTLDLRYLAETDRANLLDSVRYAGSSAEVFVSAYPGDADREADYSLIGRLAQPNDSIARMHAIWSDRLVIRESFPWDYHRLMREGA